MKFDDPRVCKSFLLSCCPHDILSSTVSDFFYKLSSKDTLPASKLSSCLFVYIMFKSKASVIVNIICVQTVLKSYVTYDLRTVCTQIRLPCERKK